MDRQQHLSRFDETGEDNGDDRDHQRDTNLRKRPVHVVYVKVMPVAVQFPSRHEREEKRRHGDQGTNKKVEEGAQLEIDTLFPLLVDVGRPLPIGCPDHDRQDEIAERDQELRQSTDVGEGRDLLFIGSLHDDDRL